MALTEAERSRVFTAVRSQFPGMPPPIPAQLAEWLRNYGSAFQPDMIRLPGLSAPTAADFRVLATYASYGPKEAVAPAAAHLAGLYPRASTEPADTETRLLERLLVYGAKQGWQRAGMVLTELIRRVVRPALRWLHRKRLSEQDEMREGKWVELESHSCAAQILQSLLHGCDCHRNHEQLTLQQQEALAACRFLHGFQHWDGREALARFLCRTAVCVYGYYRRAMDDFPDADEYCPAQLAVTEFRRGILAKIVILGRLMAGYVLRCAATPGCKGEIDPATDKCDGCCELSKSPEPTALWLWVEGQYRPEDSRLCTTCRWYYFLHHKACSQQKPGDAVHEWWWEPRRVWVRVRYRGSGWVHNEPQRHAPATRHALTPAALRRLREAVLAIPNGPVRDLATEVLCEEPDLAAAAARRKMDLYSVSFVQQFLEVLQAVPRLLSKDPGGLFGDHDTAELARLLLVHGTSLQSAGRARKVRFNLVSFRRDVFTVLTRALGAVLRAGSEPGAADRPDGWPGGADPKLLEFIAALPADKERDLARDLFSSAVTIEAVAQERGANPEADGFVQLLLDTVRAVRPALPFDPVTRFAETQMYRVAELAFGEGQTTLAEVEDRLWRDRLQPAGKPVSPKQLAEIKERSRSGQSEATPTAAVLGVLQNVIYAANGLAAGVGDTTGGAGEGER